MNNLHKLKSLSIEAAFHLEAESNSLVYDMETYKYNLVHWNTTS